MGTFARGFRGNEQLLLESIPPKESLSVEQLKVRSTKKLSPTPPINHQIGSPAQSNSVHIDTTRSPSYISKKRVAFSNFSGNHKTY